MKKIALTRGKVAFVDDEDAVKVVVYNWTYDGNYAKRNIKGKVQYMHRFILGVSDPVVVVDHINGNKLDNRKINLSAGNYSSNSLNPKNKLREGNKTGYRGVWVRKEDGRFCAQLCYKGERFFLGCYKTAEMASQVRANKLEQLLRR